jgi:small GTP-binding protein
LSTPPYEVAKKGVATIRDYFKRINMQGTDHLNEAKIIVVGSPEVGKTSLVNKVKNPSYVLQPKEAYTRGINIVQWDCSSTEKNKIIHVGIWDFGGQQLYYSTHTFFLTKRSLYILVLDARKDDCTYSDWLNLIRSLSDKSPLIIVFNEKDDLKLDITENDLRMEYPNIVGIYSTNLATNEGLPELTAGIVSAVIQLKHLNDTLPKSWISVKERLRVEKREFIEFKEFRRICSLCGIDDKDEKECLNISSYLHDLGICFHYTKDPLLAKKVFLKPEWCTEAAYSLLDNKIIREQHGFFNDETVALIWKEMKLNENRAELINLMIEFKLCFRLRESRDKFIAPLLLTKEKPQYQWDDEDNFNIRIEYEFMPQGLISTLIAKMNDHIESPELVWKTGVILRKNGTKAEVIENNRKRFVSIKVHGPDKKEFFGAIDYVFDGIHGQLDDFSFKKMIACHCPRCLSANDPYFFEYDIIRDLFNAGVKTQKCGKKPFHDVDLSIIIGEYIQGQNPIQKPGQGVIDTIKNTKVFIVHGHDNSAKSEVARFLEQLDLEPVILNEQANGGKTIIEKIEMYSEASFAVVLYTPCDLGSEAGIQNQHKYRARQNVVFEHGYLMCKLGRCNVALIIKGDIEKPSDIADATYITMDNGRGWQIELAKELKKSNFKIDFNKVL